MNKLAITLFFLITLSLISANLNANEYTAYKMNTPPVIDAKSSDQSWQKIPWAYGFKNLYEKYTYSPKQTAFKMGYDDDFLYLLIRCCEPEIEKVKTGERAFEGWPQKMDEVFFIYANSYDEDGTWEDSPYTIMEIGAGEAQRTFKDKKGIVNNPPNWRTAYSADDKNWYIETAIPLSHLEISPEKGGWFNVVRHLQTIDGSRTLRTSSWNTVTNSKLDRHTFAPLKFSLESGVKDVDKGEAKLIEGDASYGWWLNWKKLLLIKDKGGEYTEAKNRMGNSPNWPSAEQAQQKIKEVMERFPSNTSGLGEKTDAYLNWRHTLTQIKDTSPPFRLELKTRDATARVFVNGLEIPPTDGSYAIRLSDGANALTIAAKATGPIPGIQPQIPSNPEINDRWKAINQATGQWQSIDFDDSKWAKPQRRNDFMWVGNDTQTAFFRQTLIWSRNIYSGKLASIVPVHASYGFSPNTVEVLQHVIFKPTNQPLEKYVLQLEVPSGFKLLNTKSPKSTPVSWAPDKVVLEDIDVDGRPYNRYSLIYDMEKAPQTYQGKPVECMTTLLPIKHENYYQPDGKGLFRFRRLIGDNITELTTTLPIHILPPVNGRLMKSFMYPQYDHQAGRSISDELLTQLTRQGIAAGMGTWFVQPLYKGASKTIVDNGGEVVIWGSNMPLWGANIANKALYDLVQKNPEFAATYYNNTGNEFKGEKPYRLYFCPTYALGKGRQAFKDAMRKDCLLWKELVPEAKMRYLNNENYPWTHTHNEHDHRYCFCERCKNEFKMFANLPGSTPLSDQEIWDKYRKQWATFWKKNQAGLMEIAKEASNAAGLKTILYHNTGDKDAWRELTGKSDKYFIGFPGCAGHYAGRDRQVNLDDTMKFFNSINLPPFIGQRSTYFPFRSNREGRYRLVGSKDGWSLNPKQLKWEVVRMAATTHAGVVYESVMALTGGSLYYFGEATRLIATYEDLFHNGKRQDELATATTDNRQEYKYPDILVLTKGDERLVLVFNESKETKTLTLKNHSLKDGQTAQIYEKDEILEDPSVMRITVPAEDVVVIHVKRMK